MVFAKQGYFQGFKIAVSLQKPLQKYLLFMNFLRFRVWGQFLIY